MYARLQPTSSLVEARFGPGVADCSVTLNYKRIYIYRKCQLKMLWCLPGRNILPSGFCIRYLRGVLFIPITNPQPSFFGFKKASTGVQYTFATFSDPRRCKSACIIAQRRHPRRAESTIARHSRSKYKIISKGSRTWFRQNSHKSVFIVSKNKMGLKGKEVCVWNGEADHKRDSDIRFYIHKHKTMLQVWVGMTGILVNLVR